MVYRGKYHIRSWFLPCYRGPRLKAALLGRWSLTSWSSLYNFILCFIVSLTSTMIGGFDCTVGLVDYRVWSMGWWCWHSLPAEPCLLAGQISWCWWGRSPVLCPGMEGLESGVPQWVSPLFGLGPLFVVAACVAEFLLSQTEGFRGQSGTCSLQVQIVGVWVLEQPTSTMNSSCPYAKQQPWMFGKGLKNEEK